MRKNIFLFSSCIALFVMAFSASAQFGISIGSVEELRSRILCKIAVYMFQILTTVSIIMVLYAAYLYVTAGDNAEQVRKGHKTILYGVVALLVAFIASGFPGIIASIFGAAIPSAC